METKFKFLGRIIENKKVKQLTSRIERFQKLELPCNMKSNQRNLRAIIFLAKYVYGMQSTL